MRKTVRLILLAVVAALLLAAVAPAARHATISLVQAAPAFGGSFTFTTSLPESGGPSVTYWVRNECFQAGESVYVEVRSPGSVFTLGPTLAWSGGPADCVATLWQADNGVLKKPLASTAYAASG